MKQLLNLTKIPFVQRLLACFILFAISSQLILPNLGYPRAIIFDETYFIPVAQKYLNGVFFQESHPPLGKLLIALGQHWLHPDVSANDFVDVDKIQQDWPKDQDIVGYRIMPAFFGILIPVLVFLILAMVLGHELFALVVSTLVAFDNALILQSRAALFDSILIFFCFTAILVFVYIARKTTLRLASFLVLSALWGALVACAANVKLTGLFVLVLAALYAARLVLARRFRRVALFVLMFGGFFAGTYSGLWQIHFSIVSRLGKNEYGISAIQRSILDGAYNPDPLTRFVIRLRDAIDYQRRFEAGVPKFNSAKPDEIGSPWYDWPFGSRAIDYRWETADSNEYRYNYLVGNPVTWLISLLGVVLGTALVLADLLFRFLPAAHRRWLYIFVLLYWSYMIPMMFIQRVMYLYHYLPAMIIGVILFGIVLWQAKSLSWTHKRDMLAIALVLLVFSFWVYKPFTYAEPLTIYQFQQRNIWPAWDLKCVGC